MLIVSFLGFLDAAYLSIEHYTGGTPACTLLQGCEVVTTSAFATIGAIPVAYLGALYYLAIFLGMLLYIDRKNEKLLNMIAWFTVSGLVASIYFVSLQLFVIKAICQYCMGSATTSTLLFIFGMITLSKLKNKDVDNIE